MIEEWIKRICGLTGIEGCMIFLSTGEILEQSGLDRYLSALPDIAKRLLRIITASRRMKSKVYELEVVWQSKRLIGVADDLLVILTFCRNDASFPLLRMTLNVALAAIHDNKKNQKIFKKARGIRIDHLRHGDLDQSEINFISKLQ